MATNISEMSRRIAPDLIGCPRVLIDAAVVDAIIKFCEDTHVMEKSFEHDVVTADVDTADNNSVNVNIASYLTTVRPILLTEFKIDGGAWGASFIDLANVQDDISEISVQGAKLYTYPDRTHIKFYDIDAQDQRFYIKQVYVPLSTITTVDDDFFDRYHKAIEAGAKAELLDMPKKDWTDPNAATKSRIVYTDGVVSAKLKKDKGFVKGSTRPKTMRWF